jgi:hypothetical protein
MCKWPVGQTNIVLQARHKQDSAKERIACDYSRSVARVLEVLVALHLYKLPPQPQFTGQKQENIANVDPFHVPYQGHTGSACGRNATGAIQLRTL